MNAVDTNVLICACDAREPGVSLLYSEDIPGSALPGLEIVNPFA